MTDGRTSDRYIALSDIDAVSVIRAGNGITQHVESASEGPLGSAIFVLIFFDFVLFRFLFFVLVLF